MIQQIIQNDVSSTKIRLLLRRGMSVRYLMPSPGITYIKENGLYEEEGKEKERLGEREAGSEKGKSRS